MDIRRLVIESIGVRTFQMILSNLSAKPLNRESACRWPIDEGTAGLNDAQIFSILRPVISCHEGLNESNACDTAKLSFNWIPDFEHAASHSLHNDKCAWKTSSSKAVDLTSSNVSHHEYDASFKRAQNT